MPEKGHSFNALLDKERYDRLQAVAKKLDLSMGKVIRSLIDAAYAMQLRHIPTCASGQACYCPHFHPTQIPIPPTEPTPE